MQITSENRFGRGVQAVCDHGRQMSGTGVPSDKQAVLALAAQHAEQGYMSQAARAMNDYFRLVKSSPSATAMEELAVGVVLLGLWQERCQRQVWLLPRKIDFLCGCLEQLSVASFARVLKQIYQYSKQYRSFVLLFALLERAVERFADRPENLFQLWAQESLAHSYVQDYWKGYGSSLQALKYGDYADVESYAHVLVRHGNLCLQLKRYREALFSFMKGYHLREQSDDVFSLVCKVNIGRAYLKLCDYKNARKQWEEVLVHSSASDEIRIHLLTDLTFLELTRGDFARGVELYYETDRMLSQLPQEKKEAYAIEAILHERNGALIRYAAQPEAGMKQLLACAYKMTDLPLKDEIFEIVYLIVVLHNRYGNSLNEEELCMLRKLKEFIREATVWNK